MSVRSFTSALSVLRTYYGTISIKEWATEKPSSKKKEDLQRSNPRDVRWTLMPELMDLVVLLEDANYTVNYAHILMMILTRKR